MPESPTTQKALRHWNKEAPGDQHRLIAGSVSWEDAVKAADETCRIIETDEIHDYLKDTKNPVVLEIGCGLGRLLGSWPGCRVIGIDFAPNMIAGAAELTSKMKRPPAKLLVNEPGKIPVNNESVDFIYSFLVFQHIQTQAEVDSYLQESMRVLRPGGFIRIQTHRGDPQPEHVFGEWHGRFYPDLASLVLNVEQHGFEVSDATDHLWHPSWLWISGRKPMHA